MSAILRLAGPLSRSKGRADVKPGDVKEEGEHQHRHNDTCNPQAGQKYAISILHHGVLFSG
ncbi:MAG TPA: hypothetical protein VMH85_04300 [Terriglobales bacterium]|nr:hypothetical protein [Terriglobales bacterium]